MKTITVVTCFGEYTVMFRRSTYAHGNGIALFLVCVSSKGDPIEPFTCLTVNLFSVAVDCTDSPFVFLDINNNPWVLDWMCDHDFSTGAIFFMRSGFVDYPLVRLNLSRISEYCLSDSCEV